MEEVIEPRGIAVRTVLAEHADAHWRLQAPSAFLGSFTFEVDLNYIMRIPAWGIESKAPFPLDS